MSDHGSVIVTGAGRGIGLAISRAFVEAGRSVGMLDIIGHELHQAAAPLGDRALAVHADITQLDQIEPAVAQVVEAFGPPRVLINNAGSLSALGPIGKVDPARWARDVTINLVGTFNVTHTVVPRMAAAGGGHIISLVGAGVDGVHLYTTAYDASKAGVVRLMEGVSKEWAGQGIRGFALSPGCVVSAMTDFIRHSDEGRTYRPEFEGIFARGEAVGPELAAEWCVRIAGGELDALAGRWIDATRSFEQLAADAERLAADDLHVLRLRRPPKP